MYLWTVHPCKGLMSLVHHTQLYLLPLRCEEPNNGKKSHCQLLAGRYTVDMQDEDDVQGSKLKLKQYEQPGELVTLPSGTRFWPQQRYLC